MRVDEPTYDSAGECSCHTCPLEDLKGDECVDAWVMSHGAMCPTKETYQEACDLADGQPMLPGL